MIHMIQESLKMMRNNALFIIIIKKGESKRKLNVNQEMVKKI